MIFNMIGGGSGGHGGGDGNINFNVIGSIQEPLQTNENTVWLKTSIPLTGINLTKTGADYAAVAGIANIVYASADATDDLLTDATFILYDNNIGGVNGKIWAKLLKAYVSDGTKREQIEAYIRKGNVWVQFSNSYLAFVENSIVVEPMEHYGTVIEDSTGLVINAKGSSNAFSSVQKSVDLSGYNSLYLNYTTNVTTATGALDVALGVAKALRSTNSSDWVVKQGKATTSNTVTLDISNVTGEYYVHAYVRGSTSYSGTPRLTIKDMILYP